VGDILYVFISGYYGTQRKNLHRTLSLPNGSIGEYVFDYNNAAKDIIQRIEKDGSDKAYKALVVFLDRIPPDGKEYKYYPIRKAIYAGHQVKGAKVHIFLRLADYVFPKTPDGISTIIGAFDNSPKKSADNPTDDGSYVSMERDVAQQDDYCGEEAWKRAVETLHNTWAFCTPWKYQIGKTEGEKGYPIIYRIECWQQKGTRTSFITAKEKRTGEERPISYILVKPEHKLTFKVIYFFPSRDSEHVISELKPLVYVTNNTSGERICEKSIVEEDDGDSLLYEYLVPKDIGERCELTIGVEPRIAGNTEILCPEVQIELRTQHTKAKKIALSVLLALIYVFASVVTAGMTEIKQYGIDFWTYAQQNPERFISAALEVGAVMGITYLNGGKKPF